MERIYNQYKTKADIRIVYIREAHPSDGRQVPQNTQQGVLIKDPKTISERETAASDCVKNLKVTMPCVVDGMDNAIEKQYAGWPDRFYVISKDGTIVFKGDPGPRGFRPSEAESALRRLL